MDRTIQALVRSENALLESPTGTGKTLCLLCSTLAWQLTMRGKPKEPITLAHEVSSSSLKPTHIAPPSSRPPALPSQYSIIIYASRTHSQLAQVVSELRVTSYRPKLAVLGSREQLCVHPRVSLLRGGAQNHACSTTTNTRSCSYKNNLEHYTASGEGTQGFPSPVMDIEELVAAVGKRDRCCPYFYSRENSKTAELILLPYNYLLDATVRKTLGIDWANSVIIFDEAHNLEKVACDSTSGTLGSGELAECIRESQLCLKALHDPAMMAQLQDPLLAPQGMEKMRPSVSMVTTLLKALFELGMYRYRVEGVWGRGRGMG